MGLRGWVRALEPSAGVGNFLGFAPFHGQWTAVELDDTSSQILELLYPEASVEVATPFQNVTIAPNTFDSRRRQPAVLLNADPVQGRQADDPQLLLRVVPR